MNRCRGKKAGGLSSLPGHLMYLPCYYIYFCIHSFTQNNKSYKHLVIKCKKQALFCRLFSLYIYLYIYLYTYIHIFFFHFSKFSAPLFALHVFWVLPAVLLLVATPGCNQSSPTLCIRMCCSLWTCLCFLWLAFQSVSLALLPKCVTFCLLLVYYPLVVCQSLFYVKISLNCFGLSRAG